MTTLLLCVLILPFVMGEVHVERIYYFDGCRVTDKSEGYKKSPAALSLITLDCPNPDFWNKERTIRIIGEGSKTVMAIMHYDELRWAYIGLTLDCIVYSLSDDQTKISDRHYLYIDGEPVLLGPTYEIKEAVQPESQVGLIVVLTGTSIIVTMYILSYIFHNKK